MARLLLIIILLAQPLLLFADIVHRKNGGTIEGEVFDEGDRYLVKTITAALYVPKKDVDHIEKKTYITETYRDKAAAIDQDSADEQYETGMWCRENKLKKQAEEHLLKAIEIDPNHAPARAGLGHVLFREKWMPFEEKRAILDAEAAHEALAEAEAERARLEREERAREQLEARIEALVLRILGEDELLREQAADELEQIGSPAVPKLLELLDRDILTRRRVITILGRIKDPRAIEPITYILELGEPEIAPAAAVALSKLGAPAPAVTIELLDQPNKANRLFAVNVICSVKDERASDQLADKLTSDPDAEVRALIAERISYSKNPRVVDALIVAAGDPIEAVRQGAVLSLGQVGAERACGRLIESLRDASAKVRQNACAALGAIKQDEAVEPLMQIMRNDTDKIARAGAAQALSYTTGRRDVVLALIDALVDSEKVVHDHAFLALRTITKRNLPPDHTKWKRWLELYGKDYK